MKITAKYLLTSYLLAALALFSGCNASAAQDAAAAGNEPTDRASRIERGRYLVHAGLCIDCHTPFAMGPNGPAPDMTRLLSGHPADLQMPPPPELPPGPWLVLMGATNTAFAGPWGVTFSANLTSDPETGVGRWTEQMFVDTIRSGRHMGKGRPILPPMPVPLVANYTDEDLGAMFEYLQTVPPISNRVPDPILAQ